ncbi:alpha/beta fold hydrolase [Mycoplasmopsis columbina]|uniref:alpha/beta fold hydrolase n=1 Tax=Mycoplasmopsis columbina TaxID=114881 RepID=UPI0004A6E4AD|nr:alpha/beta hydrolase [Mycoplasmopsis columbina]VEU76608.1 esterase/lipase [Mycoplasmopsis columbina]
MIKEKINLLKDEITYYKDDNFDSSSLPIVLFIHGFGDTGTRALPLFKKENRNYKLISIDLPGCGESSNNELISLEYYRDILVEFVKKVLNNEDFYICAHSMGSHLTHLLSEIVSNIKHALLTAPAIYYNNPEIIPFLENKLSFFIPLNGEKLYENSLSLLAPHEEKSMQFPHVKNRILNTSTEYLQKNYDKFYNLVKTQLINFDYLQKNIKPLWKKFKNKTVLYAEFDKILPPSLIEEVINENHVKGLMAKNAGHAILFSVPEQINNLIQEMVQN